jgi:dCMP deaminase
MQWDEWFFSLAITASKKSKDPSTHVGCVIVGPDKEIRSIGYNGFARGVNDSRADWQQRPMKIKVTAHAELNAVCNAARCGATLKGCVAYVTLPPCASCALALTQAGVSSVSFVVPLDNVNGIEDRWKDDFRIALDIFTEASVNYEGFSGVWDDNGDDPLEKEVEMWITRIQDREDREGE